jgi:hypothetical protein
MARICRLSRKRSKASDLERSMHIFFRPFYLRTDFGNNLTAAAAAEVVSAVNE